jgi:hypothetical protein
MPVPDRVFTEMPEMSDSALRSLLALARLSFRFDPEEGSWVKPGRSFTRAEIQSESGLSAQGTRNGLSELEEMGSQETGSQETGPETGYVSADRSGRGHEYELLISVPTSRYTYVPTALLEAASGIGGTELRLVLAVLRGTWGWTAQGCTARQESKNGSENGRQTPEHRRWARLSAAELSRLTGRSETAVKEAARELQGQFLERLRPTGGAYYYRFLPSAVRPNIGPQDAPRGKTDSEKANGFEKTNGSEEAPEPAGVRVKKKKRAWVRLPLCGGIANDLTPDRQRSDPPHINRDGSLEKKAQHGARAGNPSGKSVKPKPVRSAVPEKSSSSGSSCRRGSPSRNDNHQGSGRHRGSRRRPGGGHDTERDTETGKRSPRSREAASRRKRSSRSEGDSSNQTSTRASRPSLGEFPERLQSLGKALMNAGVWPEAATKLLRRFSEERIRANFALFRERAPSVKRPGAWLRKAITEGYALPSPSGRAGQSGFSDRGSPPDSPASRVDDEGGAHSAGGDHASGNYAGGQSLPEPGTKVSETRRRSLIRKGLATEADFDKFADYDDPERLQHFFQLEDPSSPAATPR